ncbi:hypothetical protein DERP_013879 [Dermatophagoides pteronyssinus]|uniref:Uncharacterized protein n=1 Tax=Dermatophagoides pteronyssinus TaxID=6956 RepID=A0ABQ8J2U8_DERPT|nr:hypothetical protein DERP_013879 [Dermatophagoides pteronyssinus]
MTYQDLINYKIKNRIKKPMAALVFGICFVNDCQRFGGHIIYFACAVIKPTETGPNIFESIDFYHLQHQLHVL